MTPEEKARQLIDAQLGASGWLVQSKEVLNLAAARGVRQSILQKAFTGQL